MFNPLIHKKPYGGTAVGKETRITFPLETALGIKRVFVVLRLDDDIRRYELPYLETVNGEDIFSGAFALDKSGIWHYRFEGEYPDGTLAFFGRDFDGTAVRGDWLPEWQLTVSKCDYKTPNWFKNGIVYHIFADRFCKGEDRPFEKIGCLHEDWNDSPDYAKEGVDYRADDFFGGNIKGIESKLDYLKSLGVGCIYLSPIFEASSNHRYDTGDYLKVDSLFGDEAQLKKLIEEGEKRGISIILDGVFNHTGADSIYFNKFGRYPTLGAYQSENSLYRDWYYFNADNTYHCWWGSTVVPTVNKSAEGYRDLILGKDGVIEKWGKLGIKGWRLDVVDELPIDFTYALCGKIKEVDENAVIIGEVWEDASTKVSYSEWRPYFMGGQLDGVMNYPFKEGITDFVKGGSARDFVASISHILENYPKESLDSCMTLIDSHDTVRALTSLSGAVPPQTKEGRAEYRLSPAEYALGVKRLKLASLLQYVLPGVPCLFYGDEVGMHGFEDPLNRGTYPWGKENEELLSHYKALGRMRTEYRDLFTAETTLSADSALKITRSAEGHVLCLVSDGDGATVTVDGATVFAL